MQHDPLHRPTWREMMDHPMFTDDQESRNNKIKLDIIFDAEPEEGIAFKDNKIFVNTKDPTLYERLHKAAVEKYLDEHEDEMETHFDDLLHT